MTPRAILITTDRLVLKKPNKDHIPCIVRAVDDWNVVRWLSRVPFPYRELDAISFVDDSQLCFDNGTAYRFLIFYENDVVGCIGLERQKSQHFELGYWIARRFWGLGIGTESVKAIIQFAFNDLGGTQIEASCHYNNIASSKILAKSGFIHTGYGIAFSTALGKNVREMQYLLKKDQLLST